MAIGLTLIVTLNCTRKHVVIGLQELNIDEDLYGHLLDGRGLRHASMKELKLVSMDWREGREGGRGEGGKEGGTQEGLKPMHTSFRAL